MDCWKFCMVCEFVGVLLCDIDPMGKFICPGKKRFASALVPFLLAEIAKPAFGGVASPCGRLAPAARGVKPGGYMPNIWKYGLAVTEALTGVCRPAAYKFSVLPPPGRILPGSGVLPVLLRC